MHFGAQEPQLLAFFAWLCQPRLVCPGEGAAPVRDDLVLERDEIAKSEWPGTKVANAVGFYCM